MPYEGKNKQFSHVNDIGGFVDWKQGKTKLKISNSTTRAITKAMRCYRNLRFFNVIAVATKSKWDKSLVHTKRHTAIKYYIPLQKFAITVDIKVTLQFK